MQSSGMEEFFINHRKAGENCHFRTHFDGEAIDIDPNGALVVKKDNGKIERVIAGDCIHI